MPALTIGAGPTLGWKRQIVPCTESYVELFFVSSAGGKPFLNLLLEKSWKKMCVWCARVYSCSYECGACTCCVYVGEA